MEVTMKNVQTESVGSNFVITLINPAKRNALSLQVLHELIEAFGDAQKCDALGIVLAAQGPVFSAGHNFADMAGATKEDAELLFQTCAELMQVIQSVPQPVCASVHALATAAGCQLVATCDLAVAAESASFALPGGKGGLFCHTPLVAVARSISQKRAAEMAFTGDAISAQTAYEWGLVNQVVPDDQLDDAVTEMLRRATRGSRWSRALGKRTFYEQITMSQVDAYEFASAIMADAAVGVDAQEGIDAFLNKRDARFTQES